MSNKGEKKANPKCFTERIGMEVKQGSILLGPLKTVLKEWRRGSFLAVGTNWSRVDRGVLTPQTYVGMVKSVVVLAEALGQGRQTPIAFG